MGGIGDEAQTVATGLGANALGAHVGDGTVPTNNYGVPAGAQAGWPVPTPPPAQPPPQQNFHGDFSNPGQAENYYAWNGHQYGNPTNAQQGLGALQQRYGAPGAASQYWNGISGKQNNPGVSNNAQGAYDQFQGQQPQDMSSYYNNAERKTDEGINNQFAARGQYNSSAATDQLSEANTNLRAQEAKDNAAYGLQRGQTAGTLAQGADQSSRGSAANDLGWTTGLGGIAAQAQNANTAQAGTMGQLQQGADTQNLNELNSGMNASLGAQGAMEQRGQNYFNNNVAAANQQGNAIGNIDNAMIGSDQNNFDSYIAAMLGVPREGLNQSLNGRASSEQGIMNGVSTMGSIGKMGM